MALCLLSSGIILNPLETAKLALALIALKTLGSLLYNKYNNFFPVSSLKLTLSST